MVDTTEIESLIGSYSSYVKLIDSYNNEDGMEYSNPRISDEKALDIVKKLFGPDYRTYFSSDNKKIRDNALAELKRHGLSVRQIERLTGVTKSVIQRS